MSQDALVQVTPVQATPAQPSLPVGNTDRQNSIDALPDLAQPVAAVPSGQQFTADQLKGCWFGCCVSPIHVRARALRSCPDTLAHLCSPLSPAPVALFHPQCMALFSVKPTGPNAFQQCGFGVLDHPLLCDTYIHYPGTDHFKAWGEDGYSGGGKKFFVVSPEKMQLGIPVFGQVHIFSKPFVKIC